MAKSLGIPTSERNLKEILVAHKKNRNKVCSNNSYLINFVPNNKKYIFLFHRKLHKNCKLSWKEWSLSFGTSINYVEK